MEAQLIRISQQNGQQAVSARELHSFLESRKDFSSWMKDRIERYGFIENQDYCLLTEFGEQKRRGGHNKIEYILTVDAAKELSMVEGNEKGRQARRYFIAVEKNFRQGISQRPTLPQNFSEALRLAADQAEQIEQQQKQLEEQRPKVLFADSVKTSSKSILIAELAKIMKQNGVDIGQNRLFEWMRKKGYLCSSGSSYNQPTQKAMDLGLFEIKKTSITKPDGTVLVNTTPKVTGKGQIYFVNKFLYNQINGKSVLE